MLCPVLHSMGDTGKMCCEMRTANKESTREWGEKAGMIHFQSYLLLLYWLPMFLNSILQPNRAIFHYIDIPCAFLISWLYNALPSSWNDSPYIFALGLWNFFPFSKVLLKSYFIHVTIFFFIIQSQDDDTLLWTTIAFYQTTLIACSI